MKDELYARLEKSFERMQEPLYQLHIPMSRDENSWPGDWEGRTVLALVSLAQVLHREPLNFAPILGNLFSAVGNRGYFGTDSELIDEQQLSGNGWFLRSMCELYEWRKDERALHAIQNCIKHLYLPLTGKMHTYPIEPEQRVYKGGMAGNISDKVVNGWKVSTDTGCAYISLDGLTAAYGILKTDALKQLIVEMIANYQKIDFLVVSAQTHATLSGLRGIIRFIKIDNKTELIPYVESVFSLYQKYGMTADYENYNWFNRPEWTEPCAVVDSYICAVELFKLTKKSSYLDLAQCIYYNGFRATQRVNGGFGCNSCATGANPVLSVNDNESYWCCTMRGANGLSYVARNSIYEENDKKYVLNYRTETVNGLKIESKYPDIGEIVIHSEDVVLYIPEWAENVKVYKEGGITRLIFTISTRTVPYRQKSKKMRGPFVLDENERTIGGNLFSGPQHTEHKIVF